MPRFPKLARSRIALIVMAAVLALAVTTLAGPSATPALAQASFGSQAAKHPALRGSAKAAGRRKAVRKATVAAQKARSTAQAPATSPQPGVSHQLPAEGIFGSCQLSTGLAPCEQSLQAIHAAGFTVDVQTVNADLPTMAAFAAYAQSIGMQIMWEINDPGFWGAAWAGSSAPNDFPQFAAACGCTDSVQILDSMIQWLSAQPGTYGYYAADDQLLTASEASALTRYVSDIRAVDPAHMIMVGSNASQGTEYYSTGATIGNEIYPQTTSPLMPYSRNQATWDSVDQSAAQAQQAATRAGTQSAFILQAFSFGDNLTDGEAVGVCTPSTSEAQCSAELPYPSTAAQLQLRNEVLQHADPKLILWYCFAESYADSGRWAGLQQAVNAPYPASASAAAATATAARSTGSKLRLRRR